MAVTGTSRRNPGPRWGFAFLRAADRLTPRPLFRAALAAGSAVALACMPRQRQFAAAYQLQLAGKKPSLLQLWRHFFAFIESFMELLRLGRGERHSFELVADQNGREFRALADGPRPALFGTFHVGNSDLLGYALTSFHRRIHMIRVRMENSDDTRWLEERFGDALSFIWVDRPEEMLFALKGAVEAGHSIAMKCDRLEQSGRREGFRFLGKQRLFPFSIYHFSILFQMPVAFAIGWPAGAGRTEITASRVFEPVATEGRAANLERAREHFQAVLEDLEGKLASRPHLWFNFGPLNPEAARASAPDTPPVASTR